MEIDMGRRKHNRKTAPDRGLRAYKQLTLKGKFAGKLQDKPFHGLDLAHRMGHDSIMHLVESYKLTRYEIDRWTAPNKSTSKSYASIPASPRSKLAAHYDNRRQLAGLKHNR